MLLVIDVGNTNIVLGVFKGDELKGQWRISTRKTTTSDELGITILQLMSVKGISRGNITGLMISSVVPSLDQILRLMALNFFSIEPFFVRPGQEEYIPIDYEKPEEVGADRIVNAVAAYHFYGAPLIIIDFGTAITFCVISKEGRYLGGSIFPGIQTSASSLFQTAEKLIPVKIKSTEEIIGRNTKQAIQAGLFWGFTSLVEGMIAKIRAELKYSPRVIATGGHSSLFQGTCQIVDIFDDLLTLKGLYLIYQSKISRNYPGLLGCRNNCG